MARQHAWTLLRLSFGVYIIWVLATYLLEGRVNLLQRGDSIERALYAVIANMVIGIGLSAWLFRRVVRSGVADAEALGFRTARRTLIAVVVAAILGFAFFLLQRPVSTNAIVVLNVFTQVWPTSVAEVLVCWAVVGAVAEGSLRSRGYHRTAAIVLAVLVADLLFGVYHFAHSAPFNQPRVVVFLMLPGLATSLVYFLGRDIYATAVFHNFLGIFGVMRSIDLGVFSRPLFPLFVLALVSLLGLVTAHRFVTGRTTLR